MLEDIEIVLAVVAFAAAIVNIVLLIALLRIYCGTYKQIKSPFTQGLIFFSALFLLQQLIFLAIPFHICLDVESDRRIATAGALFALCLIEMTGAAALTMLFKNTRE